MSPYTRIATYNKKKNKANIITLTGKILNPPSWLPSSKFCLYLVSGPRLKPGKWDIPYLKGFYLKKN